MHGGRKGFDKVVWQAEKVDASDGPALKLTYTSKDSEEDYPGTLRCAVTYTLTNKNELKIEYTAETDKPTFVNLTHHSYFNLNDAGASDIRVRRNGRYISKRPALRSVSDFRPGFGI